MKIYENDGNVPNPCNNCSICAPCPITLEGVQPSERLENSNISAAILQGLKDIAIEFGNEITCPILQAARPGPVERVLPLAWRKKFSSSYLQVASGDRMGWCWDSLYGERITAYICQFAALPARMDNSMVESPSSSIPLASQDATNSSTPRPAVLQEITRMNSGREDIRRTSRGTPSLYNEKGKARHHRKHRKGKENKGDVEMVDG